MIDVHQGQALLTRGKPLNQAQAAMIMLHGRGAAAESILTLVPELAQADYTYLAPQAAGNTWYPFRFTEPTERNEPYLSSALRRIADIIAQVNAAGIPAERIVLLGFSQGACLMLEYVARNASRYGGVAGLSGGLIGPDNTPRDYPGSLGGTPVFLGCDDRDFHIPKARVDETAVVLGRLGGAVTKRFYPGLGHAVNQDEIDALKAMMGSIAASGQNS